MEEKDTKKQVNIVLTGEEVNQLDTLSKSYGFHTRSSFLRYLLLREWRSFLKKNSSKSDTENPSLKEE